MPSLMESALSRLLERLCKTRYVLVCLEAVFCTKKWECLLLYFLN